MRSLQELAAQLAAHRTPPVHQWRPEREGEIDIRIDAQGCWYHEGAPIPRPAMVRLFASILWFEHGQYFLITPAEKLAIEVADVPFILTQADMVEDAWLVTTNTDEQLIVGELNPCELRLHNGVWVPYVRVRYDLWARAGRGVYTQWVELALKQEATEVVEVVLTSSGYSFSVARI